MMAEEVESEQPGVAEAAEVEPEREPWWRGWLRPEAIQWAAVVPVVLSVYAVAPPVDLRRALLWAGTVAAVGALLRVFAHDGKGPWWKAVDFLGKAMAFIAAYFALIGLLVSNFGA